MAEAAFWGAVVGGSLVVGALLAGRLHLGQAAASALTAFGGGLLLAAVALELVPEADEQAGPGLTATFLVVGTLVYVAADWWLHRDPHGSRMRHAMHAAKVGRMHPAMHAETTAREDADAQAGKSLAAGLVIDGIPESLALGLTIAGGELGLALLAGVLLGNVVEAYGSARLIGRRAVPLFAAIGLGLAVVTAIGGVAETSDEFVGSAQAVAAGAVLAVVSITVVPETFKDIARRVAVALIAGFVIGYLLS